MVYSAPVYHVWFGIGRVSGLSGPSPFPDLQGLQTMTGSEPASHMQSDIGISRV